MLIDDGFAQIPVIAAASVASPPTGHVRLFFDSTNANRLSQKDSAGAVIDLAATGSGSITNRTTVIAFTNGDSSQIVTVTDALVAAASPPKAFSFSTTALTDADDMEIDYSATLISVATGSFVIRVCAADPEGADLTGLPIQSVNLNYLV